MERLLRAVFALMMLVSVMAAARPSSTARSSGEMRFIRNVARPEVTYQPGTSRFSQNVALKCPVSTQDGEPSVRCDVRGNCYVAPIRGVPAGVDLFRFDLNPASP